MKPSILVVDDQEAIRLFLEATLSEQDYKVLTAANGTDALRLLASEAVDLVLLDHMLPDMTGTEVLAGIKERDPGIEVIIITAFSETDTAVQAMKLGARDYVSKPINLQQLLRVVSKALSGGTAARRHRRAVHDHADLLTGQSGVVPSVAPAMHEIYATVRKISISGATTVLIEGESGVGKDVLAHVIHANSPRVDYPFLEINCASLPETLLESELFGHEKGAFTDASHQKLGLLELTNSGTLFLDEIGEMSLSIQVKLLRVLEKMNFRRVGGLEDINVDVRLIAATNRDLAQLVATGRFREDLYYRLKVVQLRIPPLRERREDVAGLADHFLKIYNEQFGKNFRGIAQETYELFKEDPWRGNIRELRNVMERAVLLEEGPVLLPEHVQLDTMGEADDELSRVIAAALRAPLSPEGVDLTALTGSLEAELVRRAYVEADGNQTRAARLLGLNRDKLRYRLKLYAIDRLQPKSGKEKQGHEKQGHEE